jgi:hypothetical protein
MPRNVNRTVLARVPVVAAQATTAWLCFAAYFSAAPFSWLAGIFPLVGRV